MMAEDVFQLYQTMSKRKIWLAFKGAISQDVLVELGTLLKNKSAFDRKVKKVFAIFIEMTQNILHYSAETEQVGIGDSREAGVGVVVVSETETDYSVSAGNLITSDQVIHLRTQCERIHGSNEVQLKQYYDERIKSHTIEGSKGAGLGLLDIARKSDYPLEYDIQKLDDSHSFFVMTARIAKGH